MTTVDAPFGSLHEHWHPGESPAYLRDAIQRVAATVEEPAGYQLPAIQRELNETHAVIRAIVLRRRPDTKGWAANGPVSRVASCRRCAGCGDLFEPADPNDIRAYCCQTCEDGEA